MKTIKGGVTSAKGFNVCGVSAGIKAKDKLDTALIVSDVSATAAIVTTTNAVKAAPVLWDDAVIGEDYNIKAVIINSGNANACTGAQGIDDVHAEVDAVSKAFSCDPHEVAVASTGVIGVPLPVGRIIDALPELIAGLSADDEAADQAAWAILTTDTVPKTAAVQVLIGGKTVTVGGMAKGSGMICPNMATMLSFVTTDCAITRDCLQTILSETVGDTYNMMSVDGDMSTNDTVLLLANGKAQNKEIVDKDSADYLTLKKAVYAVNEMLAKAIVRDGEGATKLIEVELTGAATKTEAKILAKGVVTSNLVKAAFFGEDANWGRVLSSLGSTGVAFDPQKVTLEFKSAGGSVTLYKKGQPFSFNEELAKKVLEQKEITVLVKMEEGNASAKSWGCDLTYDYVKINGEYRT